MPELPETYRCIVVKSKGADFEQETRKLVAPKKGEVLIKVLACGVCHSDSIVTQGHMPVPYPMVPGHEIVGDVVAVGDGEQKWSVGDRVGSGWEGGHCFSCQDCRRGSFTTCANGSVIPLLFQHSNLLREGSKADLVMQDGEWNLSRWWVCRIRLVQHGIRRLRPHGNRSCRGRTSALCR